MFNSAIMLKSSIKNLTKTTKINKTNFPSSVPSHMLPWLDRFLLPSTSDSVASKSSNDPCSVDPFDSFLNAPPPNSDVIEAVLSSLLTLFVVAVEPYICWASVRGIEKNINFVFNFVW